MDTQCFCCVSGAIASLPADGLQAKVEDLYENLQALHQQ